MTIREVTFVYPLCRTLSLSSGIETDKKDLVDKLLAKLQPIIDNFNVQSQVFFTLNSSDDGNGKRRIRTPEQSAAFRQAVGTFKSGAINAKLTTPENTLFEQLLWLALLGGYEDFPS